VAGAAAHLLFRAAVLEADGALEHQILQPAVFDDGDTDFPRACVNQDVLLHLGAQAIASANASTDSRNPEEGRLFPGAAGQQHWNKNR
jgi:hypothetical protein